MTNEKYLNWKVNIVFMTLENVVKSAKMMALAVAMPVLSYGQTTLTVQNSTVTGQPLTGVAATSTNKLGFSTDSRYTYSGNLGSAIGSPTTAGTSMTDAGSWNDLFYLTLSGTGTISQRDVSDNDPIGVGMTLSGTSAISSIFNYQGNNSFLALGSDNNLKLYNWGNSTPVTTLFNIGTGITGLDIRVSNTSGAVNNLGTDLQVLATTNNSLNYYTATGTSLGTYGLTGYLGDFKDVNYSNGTLTVGTDYYGVGQLFNADFSTHQTTAVPEPSTYALIFGGAALAGAAAYRRMTRVGPVICSN